MQSTAIGIGRALEKARLRRGKSLEEASRETMLRIDYIRALEAEDFDSLGGEVYARGFLRSYSRYLGLSPDKVLGVYGRAFGPPPLAQAARTPVVPDVGQEVRALLHRRPSWVLAAVAASIVMLSAAAIGLLNRSAATPEAAPLTAGPQNPVLQRGVRLDMTARADVHAVVEEDGRVAFSGRLERGDVRSFRADRQIHLELEWGRTVRVRVNGSDLGTPGEPDQPFVDTYDPNSYRE